MLRKVARDIINSQYQNLDLRRHIEYLRDSKAIFFDTYVVIPQEKEGYYVLEDVLNGFGHHLSIPFQHHGKLTTSVIRGILYTELKKAKAVIESTEIALANLEGLQ